MRPLIKTKNERNYTSFNFIKPVSAKEQQNVRFVRRVKKEVYTNITDVHTLIHAQNKASPERPDAKACDKAKTARNLDSQINFERKGQSQVNLNISKKRSVHRDFVDSSEISCLQ